MVGFGSLESEWLLSKEDSRRLGSNNPKNLARGCIELEPSRVDAYQTILGLDDLVWIWVQYGVPRKFVFELPVFDAQVNNLPLDQLGMHKEALREGLRLPIPNFIFDLLRFYGISLYTITPNSFKLVANFLVIWFLVKIRLSISLFFSFYTIKGHPYAKDCGISPLREGFPL